MDRPPGEPSDEELAARCQQGSLSAFETLYSRYQRPILAYIYQITRDYEEAACIAQDVFLKVFEKVDRFDTKRKFSTWFYTIARNASIDYLQSRRRRVMVNFTDIDRTEGDNTILAVSEGNMPAVEERLSTKEASAALSVALAELPQIYREIIELVVFQDKSYEEASEILGDVSLGTLRSRMFHALRNLRGKLAKVAGNTGQNLL
ncbi:MAG: sigma-70 family RNA polymerase sigma factor [Planctomycetota bacterium]|jgi:RNA polymerase sigma-70 factor (ECF subfamily)|nr:sigma-70 family RNA polymerase sigma factor [Planctomycetota bacterium]